MQNYCFAKIYEISDWKKLRLLSCVIVLCSLSYHGYFRNKDHQCYDNILSNPATENSTNRECLLMTYTKNEAKFCLQFHPDNEIKKSIEFIGDSTVRKFYSTFKTELQYQPDSYESNNKSHRERIESQDELYSVNFVSMETPHLSLREILREFNTIEHLPSVITIGFSYPTLDDFSNEKETFWFRNISSLAFDLDLLAQQVPTLWILPRRIQDTSIESEAKLQMYGTFIQRYKRKLTKIFKGTHVRIWDLSLIIPSSNEIQQTQVLLNLLCNKYQQEATNLCCSSSDQNYTVIAIIFGFLLAFALIFLLLECYYGNKLRDCLDSKSGASMKCLLKLVGRNSSPILEQELPLTEKKVPDQHQCSSVTGLLVKSILIFGYFYVCDRTDFLTKGKKSYSTLEFALPVAFCLFIGLSLRSKSSNDKMLNREMTDEWKGWMQLIILIYHVTGASSVLPIYMNIRILVSSYLFMTGFGNFCYYWQGGAMTFRRYCQVMLRMNMLTIVLCVVMQRSYQFYYFVPLVSFWYTILYVLLLLPPKLTLNPEGTKVKPSYYDFTFILLKLAGLFGAITVVNLHKDAFTYFFSLPLWNFLFLTPDQDVQEWWFRWKLDRYSIIFGAIFGLVYQFLINGVNPEENKPKEMFNFKTILKCILGATMVCGYSSILLLCHSKPECNAIHPYIVFVPILGFILLRNVSELVRGYNSKFFTATGKISLELFICQYHVWLAADTKGRLVLVPGYPIVNIIFVSLVFTVIAYEVHDITAQITQYIAVKDNTKMCVNLIILFSTVAICKFFIF